MHKNFLSKLEELSGKRDLTPWLLSMGMTTGIVGRVQKGERPGADLLRALSRSERVSLRWLEEGRGAPYDVNPVSSDEGAKELLDDLLAEDFAVVFATADDERFAVILHQPGQYEHKKKMIDYTIVEVVAGAISINTIQWLANNGRAMWGLDLSRDEFRRLSSGHMGNMELFGFKDARKQAKGLIERIKSTRHDSRFEFLHDKGAPVPDHFRKAAAATDGINETDMLKAVIKTTQQALNNQGLTLNEDAKAEIIALLFEESKRAGSVPDGAWVGRFLALCQQA